MVTSNVSVGDFIARIGKVSRPDDNTQFGQYGETEKNRNKVEMLKFFANYEMTTSNNRGNMPDPQCTS